MTHEPKTKSGLIICVNNSYETNLCGKKNVRHGELEGVKLPMQLIPVRVSGVGKKLTLLRK